MSLWDKLLNKGPGPKKLFLDFDPTNSTYRMVSWNLDLKSPKDRLHTIEVHKDKKEIIEWHNKGFDEVRFFRNDKLLSKNKLSSNVQEHKDLMNIAIHSTIKFSVEENHEFMVTPVSGATNIDIQNETKFLQWIQASFGTLTRALDKFQQDPNLILTGAFFSGIVPGESDRVLRVIAFNLDIIFYLKADYSLQVIVFDDKDLGHGESKTPSFQQIIKVTKPQFYDEIVKLVHKLATAGELK